MAKQKRGRVTPRGGTPATSNPSGRPSGGGQARPRRGPNVPLEGPVQPGKRPSNPSTLLLIALAWIACGVIAIVFLSASWKLIPGIVFIGVGLLFLRGAAATVSRRAGR